MRLRLLVITTIALTAGIVSVFYLTSPTCRCRVEKTYRKITMTVPDDNRRFKKILAANGVTSDGSRFDNNVYLSADCVLVEEHIQSSLSLADSNDKVRRQLESAYRLLEQKPLVDRDGNTVGGRAVAFLGAGAGRASIIKWSEKGVLDVQSLSLREALDFEREHTQ